MEAKDDSKVFGLCTLMVGIAIDRDEGWTKYVWRNKWKLSLGYVMLEMPVRFLGGCVE